MRERHPAYRSHWIPRTRVGRSSVLLFLLLLALAEPPFVHLVANRADPWILGLPFLYIWLLLVYVALIAVLVRAAWRGV
jgi:hypothetical protein